MSGVELACSREMAGDSGGGRDHAFTIFFCGVAPLLGGGSVLFYIAVEEVGVARAFPMTFTHPCLLITVPGCTSLVSQPGKRLN